MTQGDRMAVGGCENSWIEKLSFHERIIDLMRTLISHIVALILRVFKKGLVPKWPLLFLV